MAGAHLGRLSGRRKQWIQTWRQEMVDGYVGSHQDGSLPGQLLQASPLHALLTWTPGDPCSAILGEVLCQRHSSGLGARLC